MSEISSIDLTEPIWMQQPGESTRWYDRFHRYMLGGPRRSLLGCVRAEGAEQGRKGQTKKTPRSWNVAFAKFCWKDRANAWDNHQHSIDREHWDRRYRDLREAAWEMSQKLLDRHNKMLQSPMFEQEVTATEQHWPTDRSDGKSREVGLSRYYCYSPRGDRAWCFCDRRCAGC